MTLVATHFKTVASMSLNLLEHCADNDTHAFKILSDHHFIARFREPEEISPFLYVPQFRGWQYIANRIGIPYFSADQGLSYDLGDRRIRLTVCPDQSCVISWKRKTEKAMHFVPWVFKIPPAFTCGSHTPKITRSSFKIGFKKTDSSNYQPLFSRPDIQNRTSEARAMRAIIHTKIRSDIVRIVAAFDAALPLATGKTGLQDALDHKAAIPPFFSKTQNGWPDPEGFVATTLGPYIETKYPGLKNLTGQIFGRAILPGGSVTLPYAHIIVDGENRPEINKLVERILCGENSPIPIAGQVYQENGSARALSRLFVYKPGSSSAHEQIAATQRINAYLAQEDPVVAQNGSR